MTALAVSTYGATAPALTGLGAVLPHVKAAAEILAGKVGITKVGGWRATAVDMTGHPAGLAVDFMCTPAQGDSLAAYAIANAAPLSIRYIIWKQRIWHPGKDWKAMSDRGSPTANHMDHVHVSWNLVPVAGGATLTTNDLASDSTAAASTNPLDVLNPFKNWLPNATGLGLKLGLAGAGAVLVILGVWRLVLPAASKTLGAVL